VSTNKTNTSAEGRDLVLTRIIDAPGAKVFKAWSDPELLKQWFAPRPWTTPVVETDVRVGGSSLIVMRGPEAMSFQIEASIWKSSRTSASFSPMRSRKPGSRQKNPS
jgi:uncharacterized protein YndB with AHSA1/START domain